MHDAGRLAALDAVERRVRGLVAPGVRRILERHPAVAGLGERAHHPGVELAGGHLTLVQLLGFGVLVGRFELLAEQVGEVRHLLRVEQRPRPVVLDPLHEQVGHPVGEVEVVRTSGFVAGVVLELEELLDVGVPRLEVDARRALALAALVDRGHRRVERLEPRHDAVRQAVGAADQRAPAAHVVEREADAAGELRQTGDVLVAVVDRLQRVLRRRHEVARRHLRVSGAGVEQRRRRRQVVERGDQSVELDRLVCALGQAAGDPHEEVLRRLDDEPTLGIAEQVAVVDRAQAEVLEEVVAAVVDRLVELVGVVGDERRSLLTDEARVEPAGDRLREGVDVLVEHLLLHERGEQAAGEAAVARLLADEGGGRADAQLVELHRGRAVVEAADRAGGHPHRVDTLEPLGGLADGPHDLVDVDRFERAVPLLHTHRAGEPPRRVVGGCLVLLLEVRAIGDGHAVSSLPVRRWVRRSDHHARCGGGGASTTLDLVWGPNYITVVTRMQGLPRESPKKRRDLRKRALAAASGRPAAAWRAIRRPCHVTFRIPEVDVTSSGPVAPNVAPWPIPRSPTSSTARRACSCQDGTTSSGSRSRPAVRPGARRWSCNRRRSTRCARSFAGRTPPTSGCSRRGPTPASSGPRCHRRPTRASCCRSTC